jgi:hypothetical protein
MQTSESPSGSEEEGADELASVAIQTHELRAERVRREAALGARGAAADREVAEMRARIAAAREQLLELELAGLAAGGPPGRRARRPRGFDRAAADLELDIEGGGRRVAELRGELARQEAQQRAEIARLMRKVTRARGRCDALGAEADEREAQNRAARERADRLRAEARRMRQEAAAARREAARKERAFQRVARDADAIVHRVYRTKSRHVP